VRIGRFQVIEPLAGRGDQQVLAAYESWWLGRRGVGDGAAERGMRVGATIGASVVLAILGLGGCAQARFEAAVRACNPASETNPADALGYASVHEPPTGALTGGAAKNHEAAPPWVVGQPRVYPFDSGFSYAGMVLEVGREPTPLACRMSYDRQQRRALFAADPLTNVEISAVYEVPGKSPLLHAHGARDTPSAILLDAATDLVPGDEIRLAVVDRDSRWGLDDPLVDFSLQYDEGGRAMAGSQLWRGTVEVKCGHLEPEAARQAYEDALAEIDAGLRAWVPQLVPDGWDFGLTDSGMERLRSALQRAASLQLHGWDAPEVRERGQRLMATQLCFERAAEPEVTRMAARVARYAPAGLRGLRMVGTAYGCEASSSGAPACRLTTAITNADDEPTPLGFATYVQLVLAGGREIPLTLERSTVNGQTYEGAPDLPAGATATVIYLLDVPLREDRALARPVMLRDRRRKLFSNDDLVQDHPVRLAH
jgi:hypothetical protein